MIRIFLTNLDGPMLIVPARTGVTYEHQHGGTACQLAEVEGFLVPVMIDDEGDTKVAFDQSPSVGDVVQSLPDLYVSGEADVALELRGSFDAENEAFLPVTSPWGDAWLIWNNSD